MPDAGLTCSMSLDIRLGQLTARPDLLYVTHRVGAARGIQSSKSHVFCLFGGLLEWNITSIMGLPDMRAALPSHCACLQGDLMDGMEGSNGPDMWRAAEQDLGRRGSPAQRTTDSAPGDDQGRPPGLQHSGWGTRRQQAPAITAGTREASGQVAAGHRQQKQVTLGRQGGGAPGVSVGAAQSGSWWCLLRRLWPVWPRLATSCVWQVRHACRVLLAVPSCRLA